MAQTETTYYDLHKWDQDETSPLYTAALHNENTDAIDRALAEMPLGLKYFRDRARMPANLIIGDYGAFPARDFTNLNAGDTEVEVDNLVSYYVSTNADKYTNAGWALGATYTKALFVMPSVINPYTGPKRMGIWVAEAAPPAVSGNESIPTLAHFGLLNIENGSFSMYETDGAGSGLAGTGIKEDSNPSVTPTIYDSNQTSGARGMALYVDGSNVELYLLINGTWFMLFQRTGITSLTDFTHCGVIMKATGHVNFAGPVVAFAE